MFLLGTNIKYGTHGKVDIFTLWLMTILKEHYYLYYSQIIRHFHVLKAFKISTGRQTIVVSSGWPSWTHAINRYCHKGILILTAVWFLIGFVKIGSKYLVKLQRHYVLRALKTSQPSSRCQTYVFKTKIA